MKTITDILYPAFTLIALACFGLSSQAQAACQEGCLTNSNTVLGEDSLLSNTGDSNTAIGFNALLSNTNGHSNTAVGSTALDANTTASFNTGIGWKALGANVDGWNNTAIGAGAIQQNTRGQFNSALGMNALFGNTTGSLNIAIGSSAGANLNTGSNNIDIGNAGIAGESSTIRIGSKHTHVDTYIAGIYGAAMPTGIAVLIDRNGHMGTTTSSARFKEAIAPMDKASEAILALKPVTFHYKHELDPAGISQFGLVAEQVEKVNPDLVARDEQGKPYAVRYEAVNAMLLNEFLKEHETVQEQAATIARMQKQIETLTSGLGKVSAQLSASKPAPQVVNNP